MIKRSREVLAGLFMASIFLCCIAVGVVLLIVFLVGYLLTGSQWLRTRIVKFGQALDCTGNVVIFDGDPRETISSHAGRFYSTKYGNPHKPPEWFKPNPDQKLPWQAIVVHWITERGETDHVYHAVEAWTIAAGVEL